MTTPPSGFGVGTHKPFVPDLASDSAKWPSWPTKLDERPSKPT